MLNELKVSTENSPDSTQFRCTGPIPWIVEIPENERPESTAYEKDSIRTIICPKAQIDPSGTVFCGLFPRIVAQELEELRIQEQALDQKYQIEWSINMGDMTRNPKKYPIYEQKRAVFKAIYELSTHPCRPAYTRDLAKLQS